MLGPGPTHVVVVRGDEALRPATVTLRAEAGDIDRAASPPTPVPVTPVSPTHLTGAVPAGPQRLLALTMNHNAGWEATLDGVELTPVVVDGFRQGYVLPEGAAGALEVVFTPDAAYRWALGLGLLLVLLLPVALLVPDRDRAVVPATVRPDPRLHPVVVAAGVLGYALVVAGPWAALSAAVALAALRLRRRDSDARVAVAVVGLVTAAGVLVALADPAHQAQPWVEAVASVAVIAAGVLAGAAPLVPPRLPAVRWRRGSARRGTG